MGWGLWVGYMDTRLLARSTSGSQKNSKIWFCSSTHTVLKKSKDLVMLLLGLAQFSKVIEPVLNPTSLQEIKEPGHITCPQLLVLCPVFHENCCVFGNFSKTWMEPEVLGFSEI